MVCYLFYLIAAPFAAKLSGAVRATDVMVNTTVPAVPSATILTWSVQQSCVHDY